ncbi:MAG: hypothetical protein GY867_07355, partial [bacterium]|nr:hypothetical protein [bacterium]
NFQHRFETVRNQAQTEFRKLKAAPGDSRVYQLKTPEQLVQRYRKMLSQCRRVAFLDFFPDVVELLRDDLASAARRGVKITLKVYAPVRIRGVEILVKAGGEKIVDKWPGQWANGVFDAEEYLLAFLSRDGRQVYQAVWSNNHFLSWIYYGGFVNEMMADALEEGLDRDLDREGLHKIIKKHTRMLRLEATGYKDAASFFIGPSNSRSGKRK